MSYETFPGQDRMIKEILRIATSRESEFDLEQLSEQHLTDCLAYHRAKLQPHHEPRNRPRAIINAQSSHTMRERSAADPAPPIEALPSWAQPAAIKARARRVVPPEERAPRYKAQLWHNGHNVHIGTYDTPEERDDAVRDAKARRSIGLPLRG